MIRYGRQIFALAGTLAIGACGGDGAPANAQWAADACQTLPASAAGKAAGLTVTDTTGGNTVSTAGTNVSSCTYTGEGGVIFTVGLRHDTTGQTTMDQAIAGLKAQPDMTGPVEEVAFPSGKAFWTPRFKTLSYLPDDARMVTVTPPGANVTGGKSDPDDVLKQKALAIAQAAAR